MYSYAECRPKPKLDCFYVQEVRFSNHCLLPSSSTNLQYILSLLAGFMAYFCAFEFLKALLYQLSDRLPDIYSGMFVPSNRQKA